MKTPDKTMMHASDWDGRQDVTDWILQQKLDGHFARWTGKQLLTREGVELKPHWMFTRGLPPFPLDCELIHHSGRVHLNNCHKWTDKTRWLDDRIHLAVFDWPQATRMTYLQRHKLCQEWVNKDTVFRNVFVLPLGHGWLRIPTTVQSNDKLIEWLELAEKNRIEGFIIREPDALYTVGRVKTMLKVKP